LIAFETAPLVASSTCLAEADSLPPSPTSKATDPELGTENEVKETFMSMSFGRLNSQVSEVSQSGSGNSN
jgi:hypothetical protein